MRAMNFCGVSGRGYGFESVEAGSAWARQAGIAIFAAPGAFGRRVIRVVELSGRAHDVRPIWALAEAERYGASEVYVRLEDSPLARRTAMADLEAGLRPVCGQTQAPEILPVMAEAA